MLTREALAALPGQAVSYGKPAIVGANGNVEHGHAMLHPKPGKTMRDPTGGGAALIPSDGGRVNARVGKERLAT